MKKKAIGGQRTSRTVIRKRKSHFPNSNIRSYVLAVISLIFLFLIAYHYRNGLFYYLAFKSTKVEERHDSKRFTDVRNFQLLSTYSDKVVGIDVSQYLGKIQWDQVKVVEHTFPIQYVFVRATEEKDKLDSQFERNWSAVKKYVLFEEPIIIFALMKTHLIKRNFLSNMLHCKRVICRLF
jgi:lysozyme